MKKFTTAIEYVKYLHSLKLAPEKEEQLMLEGIKNAKIYGWYFTLRLN